MNGEEKQEQDVLDFNASEKICGLNIKRYPGGFIMVTGGRK